MDRWKKYRLLKWSTFIYINVIVIIKLIMYFNFFNQLFLHYISYWFRLEESISNVIFSTACGSIIQFGEFFIK